MSEQDELKCPHPPEERKEGLRRLGDREVRIQECGLCGRILVDPADGERALSERGPEGAPVLDARSVVLALLGMATLWMAVFADMGASLLVILNGMRLLRGDSTRG